MGEIMAGNCLSCHSSCGDCHVGTPPAANERLQKSHSFAREPDDTRVCLTCHYLKVGFFVEKKKLHSELGMDCLFCHSSDQEFHGRGGPQEQVGLWTQGLIQANCYNCHQQIDTSNEAHEIHNERIACQSCHGTEYDNCIACHEGKAEKIKSFKLGDYQGKIYPFVNTASVTADMYAHMGIQLQARDLKSKGTWVPFPTHFLQRAPILKEGGEVMCDNCHGNPDVFLKQQDLIIPELEQQVLVDPLPEKLE